ncbi:MAG: DUF4340 domain-containing protein [Gammaproteobacteria bacterium]|nr:DUF4340 domain-containing protein [Gammaproteobacteria bacterium]
MSRRTLILLLGGLVVLAILALLAGPGGRRDPDEQLLFPELKAQLNEVSSIVVHGPGNQLIATLKRSDARWIVAERNYPADLGMIRANLLALAEARIVEEKTSTPELYDRLGVQNIALETARGIQLEIGGTRTPVRIIIGEAADGGSDMSYVRRAAEAQSWLVNGRFNPGRTTGEWLDRQLLDIPATRIQSVSISHPGLDTLRLTKAGPNDADFSIADLPAGREPSYPGVGNTLGTLLAGLQTDDVHGREALGDDPGKPVVARFRCFDGLIVEASAWRTQEGTRMSFLASIDPAQAEGQADAPATDAVRAEAAAINARLGGWIYTLPGHKTEQFTRRLQDLLAPAGIP